MNHFMIYFFYRLGRHKDSFQTAMDLYKQMPKDVQVINKLGVCYLYLGKNAAAKQVFEKVSVIFCHLLSHLQTKIVTRYVVFVSSFEFLSSYGGANKRDH